MIVTINDAQLKNKDSNLMRNYNATVFISKALKVVGCSLSKYPKKLGSEEFAFKQSDKRGCLVSI